MLFRELSIIFNKLFYSINQMVQELNTVWRVVSLPLLEPLSATRLHKLSTIAMAAIFAALTVATAIAIINVANPTSLSSKVGVLLNI